MTSNLHDLDTGPATALQAGAPSGPSGASGQDRRVRMIIADPNEVYRMGVKSLVSDLDYAEVVGEAADAKALEMLLETVQVDLVLLDPGIAQSSDGDLAVIERVGQLAPAAGVVVVTDTPQAHTRKAIELGVSACLRKTAASEELVAALRLVASGRHYIPADLIRPLLRDAARTAPSPGLSRQQVTILQLLSRGLKNKQIASELGTSMTTLKSHLRLIYSQLAASSRAEAAAAAVRLGIIS